MATQYVMVVYNDRRDTAHLYIGIPQAKPQYVMVVYNDHTTSPRRSLRGRRITGCQSATGTLDTHSCSDTVI